MGALDGKSALVTGGAGAIGEAAALELVRHGAAVTLMGRGASSLEAAGDRILAGHSGGRVAIHPGDSTMEADVRAAADAALRHGGRLDIVVATVGGGGGYRMVEDHSLESFMADLTVNLGAPFLAVSCCAPLMTRGGTIVLVSSNAALMPFVGMSGYCAGKAGLEQFVRCAANELGPRGIRINAVRPGLTRSSATAAIFDDPAALGFFVERMPLGRAGEPGDIASVIRFLAGPDSGWITGQSIAADGGNELRGAPMSGAELAMK